MNSKINSKRSTNRHVMSALVKKTKKEGQTLESKKRKMTLFLRNLKKINS